MINDKVESIDKKHKIIYQFTLYTHIMRFQVVLSRLSPSKSFFQNSAHE
jgi:hypothetical protein